MASSPPSKLAVWPVLCRLSKPSGNAQRNFVLAGVEPAFLVGAFFAGAFLAGAFVALVSAAISLRAARKLLTGAAGVSFPLVVICWFSLSGRRFAVLPAIIRLDIRHRQFARRQFACGTTQLDPGARREGEPVRPRASRRKGGQNYGSLTMAVWAKPCI